MGARRGRARVRRTGRGRARGRRLRRLRPRPARPGGRLRSSRCRPSATCSPTRAHAARDGRAVRRRLRRSASRPRRRGGFSPAVDVFYGGDPPRAVVTAEVAGMDPDELGLEINGRELVISGHRRPRRARGPRLPADGDRTRAVPAHRGAGRQRGRRRAGASRTACCRWSCRWPEPAARRARADRSRIEEGEVEMIEVARPAARAREVAGSRRSALPRRCPVLPLRESVTFPETVTPLAVGQERRWRSSTMRSAATGCW